MLKEQSRVGVISAGALGSTFADIVADLDCETTLFFNNPDGLREFERTRISRRLPTKKLSKKIRGTSNLQEVANNKDIIFISVPSRVIPVTLDRMFGGEEPLVDSETVVVLGTKGLVEGVNSTISTYILDKYPNPDLVDRIAVWSGPNKVEELIRRQGVTGTVIAAYNSYLAEQLQHQFSTPYLRIYTSDDPVGVEAGGALKNVFAFGMGIARGLGAPGNTEALFYTRALEEMGRLAMALGAADKETIYKLSGNGDLYRSCIKKGTRNSRAGIAFAKGKSLEQLLSSGEEIESLHTIKRVYYFALERGIDVPITTVLYRALYEGLDIREGIQQLTGRKLTKEDTRFNPRNLALGLTKRGWYRVRGILAPLI